MDVKRIPVFLLVVAFLGAAGGCSVRKTAPQPQAGATPLTLEVFVPCGVGSPFTDVRQAFEAKNPGVHLKMRMENTNVLMQRILDGARPDVCLALGDVEVERLRKAGLVEEGSVKPLAGNYVGLVAPAGNPGGIQSFQDLANPSAGEICLADPEENSSGRHLQRALQKAGIWDQVKARLVATRFPAEVQANVAQGKVNVGAIYGPCFVEGAKEGGRPEAGTQKGKVMYLLTVPAELAGEFQASAVAVKGAAHREQALRLAEFMAAAESRTPWVKWGFDPLPGSSKGHE